MHDIDQEVGHFGLSDNEKGPEEVKKKKLLLSSVPSIDISHDM